jgi:hypothetical protein
MQISEGRVSGRGEVLAEIRGAADYGGKEGAHQALAGNRDRYAGSDQQELPATRAEVDFPLGFMRLTRGAPVIPSLGYARLDVTHPIAIVNG